MKIGKYAFVDKAQADSKIEALGVATDEDGNNYPTHKLDCHLRQNYQTNPNKRQCDIYQIILVA